MAAGKNKLTRHARLYLGGYNLSGDTRTFNTLEDSMGEVDVTGLSNAAGNYLADKTRVLGVLGYQALMNNTALSGASSILATAPKNHILSVLLGGGGEPEAGDLAYLLAAVQLGDLTEFASKAGVIQADFRPNAAAYNATVDTPWGVVLHPETALAGTTTGSSVDNGAATTAGGYANLHIVASSGGTWQAKVQHSTDNSVWADLLTFDANGAAVLGEQKVVTGTINRYVRAVLTRTSGTLTPVVVLARN